MKIYIIRCIPTRGVYKGRMTEIEWKFPHPLDVFQKEYIIHKLSKKWKVIHMSIYPKKSRGRMNRNIKVLEDVS